MKMLLLVFMACCPLVGFSQQLTLTGPRTLRTTQVPNTLHKVVNDTIVSPDIDDDCRLSLGTYGIGVDSGFVFGTNILGDLLVMQRFVYTSSDSFEVNSVNLAFAGFDESAADGFISVGIFAEVEPFGTLDQIAVSDSIRIGDVAVDDAQVLFTQFDFTETAAVTNDSFFVALILSSAYNSDTTGFVSLLGTLDGCGNGENVIFVGPTPDGNLGYVNALQRYNLNAEIFMIVDIDQLVTTSNRNPFAEYKASVAPNPTMNATTLIFTPSITGAYATNITDLTGRLLVTKSLSGTQGVETRQSIDVASLPAGVYLYHIDGPTGRQSGKLVKR